MSIRIGEPRQPEQDERPGFYICKNLTYYLDTQPNGVYVEAKDGKGNLLFRVHKGNVAEAMSFIEHDRELLGDANERDGNDHSESN